MRHNRYLSCAAAIALLAPALAVAETRHFEHRFDAHPGNTVVVDVSFHEVEVSSRAGTAVDVAVELESSSQKLLEELAPRFEEKEGKLVVRSVAESMSWLSSGEVHGRVTVAVPPGVNLLVDSSSGATKVTGDFGAAELKLDCSSGAVAVDGAADKVVVDSSSGSVKVTASRPVRKVEVDVSSGSVTVSGPVAELDVNSSSGSVTVTGLSGNAKLSTSSGGITGRWSAVPAGSSVEADASSGSVQLAFPRGTVLAGDVDTSSGAIRSDFPGSYNQERDHLTLAGGAGAVQLKVDSSSGSVTLTAE